jgi:hypothetical protein
MKFVTNLDLNQNQLIKGTFEVLGADPNTNLFDGRMIFNSTEGVIKVYDATASAWRKMITGVSSAGDHSTALTINETNGVISITPNLATSASAGLMSASDYSKLYDATSDATANKLVIRDAGAQAKFGTPTDPLHAATKGYVDAARSGLDVKQSVRAATTATVNLSTDVDAGSIIDGVTLAEGDRILVKNQGVGGVAHVDNGIYVVAASGAPTRAADADSDAEVTPGLFTFVEEGTANGDSGWVLATNGTISLGSTALLFAQFSGTGQITAGDGLTKSGNTLYVNVDNSSIIIDSDTLRIGAGAAGAGLSESSGSLSVNLASTGGLEFNGDNIRIKIDGAVNGLETTSDGLHLKSNIAGTGLTFSSGTLSVDAISLTGASGNGVSGILPIANGGTNANSESSARTNLAAGGVQGAGVSAPVLTRKVVKTVGNGVDASFTLVHAFNTTDVSVQVYESSTGETVISDVARTDADTVTVSFSTAPSSNAYKVVVIG